MHFGSLFSALASFIQARSQCGKWLLRIDDLDTPRNVAGATDSILKTLDHFGLHWDESILYQSRNSETYLHAIETLDSNSLLYPCTCSRKSLTQYRRNNPNRASYPGTCRDKQLNRSIPHALRIKTGDALISFEDTLQGRLCHQLADQHGDFIVKRRDQIIAYQLAVVVDDQMQQITEVVRGYDLLISTPKQIYLQQLLHYHTPEYMHTPVITDQKGSKLSKQTFARAVGGEEPDKILFELLQLMNQRPPEDLRGSTVNEILSWAIKYWNPDSLKNIRAITQRIN